jgi:hypothetical protein
VESVERRIFDCPKNKGNDCPVEMKFKENNKGNPKGDVPIPEAYLGNPEARFMIIGINPGQCENYLENNFEAYQHQIRGFLKSPQWKSSWTWDYAVKIFGYPSRQEDGVLITNVVHCPTPSWRRQKEEKWRLSEEEKQMSIELCNHFCFEIIEKVNPELILLHGLDTVRFFADHCGWWDIDKNAENKDIHGLPPKICDNRTFVLSRHLTSMCFKKGQGKWIPLEEIGRSIKRNK